MPSIFSSVPKGRVSARLRRRGVVAVIGAISLTGAFALSANANITGSTFEGNDGNLVVDTAGNTDWANVSGLNTGIDLEHGSGDNAFGQGSKEDLSTVTVVDGSIPPNKNDLTRFYEASSQASNGDIFLDLSWERLVNIGNANLDFEINKSPTTGWTAATTGPVTINRSAGDLLVTYDFPGSGTPTLGLNTWVTSGSTSQCLASNSLPCWGNHVALNGTNSEGAVNTGTVTEPIAGGSLTTGLFGEAVINLTAAGVFKPGVCEAFGSAFVKSRSSSSFGAELKDFIAPIPVNISNCSSITIKKVTQNEATPGTQSFDYTTTGTLTPTTFSLKNGGQQVYSKLGTGTYSFTETTPLPTGWTLDSLVCDTTTGVTITSPTVSIVLSAGENVTCTYTNKFKNSPSVSTAQNLIPNDAFTLSGASSTAGGSITFNLYSPSDSTCSGTPALTQTVPVSGNGTYKTTNTTYVASAEGTWRWASSYTGDTNNSGASSACGTEQFTIKNS